MKKITPDHPERSTTTGRLVGLRWQADDLAKLDEWRRDQTDLPSQTEAIRRLVRRGIYEGDLRTIDEWLEETGRTEPELCEAAKVGAAAIEELRLGRKLHPDTLVKLLSHIRRNRPAPRRK